MSKDFIKKTLFLAFGCVFLFLGIIGCILPILPTTPFLLLASFCFVKGSERVSKWFENTNVYKKHVVKFKTQGGLTLKSKVYILAVVYAMLIFLFIKVDNLPMRICIIVLLTVKTIVFIKIKTIRE